MSSDLEKFLQQAAEKLAQKANAAGSGRGAAGRGAQAQRRPPSPPLPSGGPARQEPPRPPRGAQRQVPTAEIIEAEVIDGDEQRRRALREAGSDPLSTIDTRPGLAQTILQADERMGSHVQRVFDHQLTQLRAPSAELASGPAGHAASEPAPAAKPRNPVVDMLRSPDSLRAAFIASEIFKRRT